MKYVLIVVLLCLLPGSGSATVDRLGRTYQALYDPNGDIRIVPVYFLTCWPSPEAEVGAAAARTYNFTGCPALGGDSNVASLYHVRTRCASVGRDSSAVVDLDLSGMCNADGLRYTESEVLESVVDCLTRVMTELGYRRMDLIIRCPEEKLQPEWMSLQRTYILEERQESTGAK
jgi:hypothetical protein